MDLYRPERADEYVAMTDGPVQSLAYDVLKEALAAWKEAEITEPLWSVQPTKGLKNIITAQSAKHPMKFFLRATLKSFRLP
jgi:hypothetical protein